MSDDSDMTHGIPAQWDKKAVQIIRYVLGLQGQPYNFADVSRATGIATVEVSRYLKEHQFERRDWKWLAVDMRNNRPTAYQHYLMNHEIRKKELPDGTIEHQLYVNFSKHNILLRTARLMNLHVVYKRNPQQRKFVYFFPSMEDIRTQHVYITGDIELHDLYDF